MGPRRTHRTPRTPRPAARGPAGPAARRLFAAAAAVFARVGYADATAEAIAREAGMSKATFYEHFDNKEDCIVALFDAAIERDRRGRCARRGERSTSRDPRRARVGASVRAFLAALDAFPDRRRRCSWRSSAPARGRRRAATPRSTPWRTTSTSSTAPTPSAAPRRRFASPHDAFAIVGAVVELASRQIRTGARATSASSSRSSSG